MKKEMQWHKIFETMEEACKAVALQSTFAFRIGMKKICLARTEEGLFAFEDACPHKLARLSQGRLTPNHAIVCYWHYYVFDIRTGQEITGKNIRSLKTYPLKEEIDGLYIGLPAEAPRDEFSF